MHSVLDQERLPTGTVLIAGGGPVGLVKAKVLSHYGIRSVLCERNSETTKWPKMDLTNVRSMEIFRRLGLAEGIRKLGVPAHIDQPVLISSGLGAAAPLTSWQHPGVDSFRRRIEQNNDGTQPLEPWQRISQAIFEKWIKELCDQDPLVDVRFGCRVESVKEKSDSVRTTVVDTRNGVTHTIVSDYLVGCDGASSRVRKSLAIPLDGGPIEACVLLVHFKSRDLKRLHKHGRFWHIFMLVEPGVFGGAVIAQDEEDTFTVHYFIPLDADPDIYDSKEVVATVLGGLNGSYPIEIDEILVRSVWRPNIAIARAWSGPEHRVFIAGDAAHQNIPTGGYGMNTGIADAYDIGWKLAAVINYAHKDLLKTYEMERRPIVMQCIDRSGVHMAVHQKVSEFLAGGDPHRVDADTEEGRILRQEIHEHYATNDGENTDWGIELGYRYSSPAICREAGDIEPHWSCSYYTPTSWPGGRPPHIFLCDGSPIFDKFGKDWTLLRFTDSKKDALNLIAAAKHVAMPLTHVDLSNESQAKQLYERHLVLMRPDQHVAWRGNEVGGIDEAIRVLQNITGCHMSQTGKNESIAPHDGFTATTGLTTQTENFEMERMGDFQR